MNWKYICLVGLGKHSKTKLIPAIQKSNKVINSIVSRKVFNNQFTFICYSEIKQALKQVPKKTLFVLSTPPHLHYIQAKEILLSGFDVMVEKPAFLSIDQLFEIQSIAKNNNLLMIEMFMYYFSDSFKLFCNEISKKRNLLSKIKSNFIIPEIPKNTFRDESSFENSLLSDIGCYPISFLEENNISLMNLKLSRNFKENKNQKIFNLNGNSDDIQISISIGKSNNYSNYLKLYFKDNSSISCEPFYYGVKTRKSIIKNNNGIIKKDYLEEENMFEKLFLQKRDQWIENQKKRFAKMILVTKTFENLKKDFPSQENKT